MKSKSLVILFYGILMGTANKIPGVSGGLVAIAIGFYEKPVSYTHLTLPTTTPV